MISFLIYGLALLMILQVMRWLLGHLAALAVIALILLVTGGAYGSTLGSTDATHNEQQEK